MDGRLDRGAGVTGALRPRSLPGPPSWPTTRGARGRCRRPCRLYPGWTDRCFDRRLRGMVAVRPATPAQPRCGSARSAVPRPPARPARPGAQPEALPVPCRRWSSSPAPGGSTRSQPRRQPVAVTRAASSGSACSSRRSSAASTSRCVACGRSGPRDRGRAVHRREATGAARRAAAGADDVRPRSAADRRGATARPGGTRGGQGVHQGPRGRARPGRRPPTGGSS